MTPFEESVAKEFPGALPAREYLDQVRVTLDAHLFTPERTLPMVSICRDELTAPLCDRIEELWGPPFTLAGLGGVPALGATGWHAALSHIPNKTDRGAVVVFGFPHIGIEADGSVGVTLRQGQLSPTATCGALSAIHEMACSNRLPSEIDLDDYEATKLALRLVDPLYAPSSLVELTVAALDALEHDLWAALDAQRIWADHDVTVWCGVQIHGPGGTEDWIWPRDAWYARPDGERTRFELPHE
jgi:hypothetical protein